MLKIGTVVSTTSTTEPLNGIVVGDAEDTVWASPTISMVLITSSGDFHGTTHPFTDMQLEIISDPS